MTCRMDQLSFIFWIRALWKMFENNFFVWDFSYFWELYIIKDFFPRHFDIHRFNREKEERRQRGLLFCTHTTKTTTTIFSPRLSVSIVYTSREKKKNPNLIV